MILKNQSLAHRLFLLIVLSGIVCGISAAQSTPKLVPVDATETTITFYVRSGADDGLAIEGAQIKCIDGGSETHYATTNSRGRAKITGISGSWKLYVAAPDYLPYNGIMTTEVWKDRDLIISMQKSKVTLSILVSDDTNGSPVEGARVNVTDGRHVKTKYYTDSEGRVEASGVSGYWEIHAEAFGYYPSNKKGVSVREDQNTVDLIMVKANEVDSRQPSQEQDSSENFDIGSESSVVGKWAFHFIRKSWESSHEKVTRNSDSEDEWDSTIAFHSDGTFTESTSYMSVTGKWTQKGDTIRLQDSQEFRDGSGHYICISESSDSRNGRIENNIMSGEGSSLTHMTVTGDDSYSAEISETYTWSASRVD
jgi:hypothetical protein